MTINVLFLYIIYIVYFYTSIYSSPIGPFDFSDFNSTAIAIIKQEEGNLIKNIFIHFIN